MKRLACLLAALGLVAGQVSLAQEYPSKSPEAFAKYVADQLAHRTKLIRPAGIEPE